MPSPARQAIPVLRDAAALLRLLDALHESTQLGGHPSALVQFHDNDGSLTEALIAWAGSRSISIDATPGLIAATGETWNRATVDFSGMTVVIHDSRSHQRPEPANDTIVVDPIEAGWTWSPAHNNT